MSAPDLIRIRNFHAPCGARIFTSYDAAGAARYHATDRAHAAALTHCPACQGALVTTSAVFGDTARTAGEISAHYRPLSTVATAHDMEQRWLAARERLCAGGAVDAEAIVCLGAELEEGATLEEIAPLYGHTADTLREEITAFTHASQPIEAHTP